MRAFQKLVVTNLKEFGRDRTSVIITVLVPVLFIFFFGMAFGGMESGKYKVGLVVEDESPLGQSLAQALDGISVFDLVKADREKELDALRKGDRRAVILIPEGVGSAAAGGKSKLEVYYDATNAVASQTILGVMRQVVGEMDRQITGRPTVLEVDTVSTQTRRLRDIDFLLPGILGMGLMWLGIFNSIPLVRQRQTLILKRYGATPLSRAKLVSAQVVSRLLVSIVQAAIIVAVGRAIFNVQNVGSWYLLGLLVILGTLAFVALGYVIAAVARTEEAANGMSQLLNFPLMFLSGVFFPAELMPKYLEPVIRILPLTYLNDSLRQVMLNGAGIQALVTDMAVLAIWSIACLLLSIRFFRWT
ncbi:MAG: ABC transporter permease [Chloroflexi bacterium]|nr:ABC transporter permease [Chloroflexota bacterium]